jgi:hypothetical protein
MARPDPIEARFPNVPAGTGHYESFYLKACDPHRPLGVWIRYTVHKRPGAEPNGSLWFTLFDGEADGPRAQKVTLPAPRAGGDDWIRVGEASIGAGAARGALEGVDWELRFESSEAPLLHLPRDWMYRARLPRTKLLSPAPAARFDGSLSVDGRTVPVEGWRGMVGHNWGAQHAERWIWLHGIGFDGAPDAWLDVAIGRVRVGRAVTPWVANGALSLDGTRHRLGGIGRVRSTRVDARPGALEAVIGGAGVTIRASVSAPLAQTVAFVYADPAGGEHHALNCSIAQVRLRVERPGRPALELASAFGGAYELGMRETHHGVELQPFPDP